MVTVVVVADAQWVREQVRLALAEPGVEIVELSRGQEVRATVGRINPELVVADLQIGNMGGVAVTLDLRLEESGGRLGRVPVLLLLDRPADRFLARRSGADASLVKPLDARTLRKTARALLDGEAARRRVPFDPSG